jgi:peptidoglycan/xylan/chitin deacetylase (PgdA/CDA1 family)
VCGAALVASCTTAGNESGNPTTGIASTTAPTIATSTTVATSTTAIVAPSTVAPTTSSAPSTTSTTEAPFVRLPSSSIPPVVPGRNGARVVSRIDTTDPVLFLTIDDGIVRDPRVPEFLAAHDIPVTLFVTSGAVHEDPAYFAQFLDRGTVNSHTRHHPDMTTLDEATQRSEICGGRASIERALGTAGTLFRPPYGTYDAATRRAAAYCGLNAVVLWRETLWDGNIDFAPPGYLRAGDIVLAHFRTDLYDNLVLISRLAEEAGLVFARLEDYLPAA